MSDPTKPPPPALNVSVMKAQRVAVLFPSGTLHREGTETLLKIVDQVASKMASTVVVSFSEVTGLLSEGIRLLITIRDCVDESGKKFYITDLSHDMQYTLKITNLLEFLNHVKTLDEILESEETSRRELREIPIRMRTTEIITSPTPKPRLRQDQPEVSEQDPAQSQSMDAFKNAGGTRLVQRDTQVIPPPTPPAETPASTAAEQPAEPAPAAPPPAPPEERPDLSRAELREAIHAYVPGRLPVSIVNYFLKSQRAATSVLALCTEIGESERSMRKAVEDLAARGILQAEDADRYSYRPEPAVDAKIRNVVKQYTTPRTRSMVLSMLLATEPK